MRCWDVPALFQGLVDAAPNHVFDFVRVDLDVAFASCRSGAPTCLRRGCCGACLERAHWRATEVDNHHVS